MSSEEKIQKRTAVQRVEGLTAALEQITDEVAEALGSIITKTTPLLAPVASGLTVLFAFYDGGGRMFAGTVKSPYLISFAIGFLLMLTIEGIQFSAIYNRDRANEVRRKNPNALIDIDPDSIVNLCLFLTLGVVFLLESLPGVVSWWFDEMPTRDMIFRVGLLILPIFSRAGARIFSLAAILDTFENTRESRRLARESALLEREARAVLAARDQEEWQAKRRREEEEWAAKQRREEEEHALRMSAKASKVGVQKPSIRVQVDSPAGETPEGTSEQDVDGNENGQKKGNRMDMLRILEVEPDLADRELARRLNRSPTTVGQWRQANGFHKN